MPDLIDIQGDVELILALNDISTLEIIADTGKVLESGDGTVSAFADSATQATVQGRGLTVTVVKTEAEFNADLESTYAAINDTPFDVGGST